MNGWTIVVPPADPPFPPGHILARDFADGVLVSILGQLTSPIIVYVPGWKVKQITGDMDDATLTRRVKTKGRGGRDE